MGAVEMIVYWFQAKLLSKYSSIVSLIAYGVVSLYKIYLLVTGKGVRWFAVSNAFDYMIISVLLLIIYCKLSDNKLSFSWNTAKKMFLKSKYYIIANMIVLIYSETDKIMLKLMLNNTVTGYYSAAVRCASITAFVFSAIIDSFRPIIFDAKKNNEALYELNLSGLNEYQPAGNALRIIVWYTTFSYLGSVRNIWILAEEKQKYLWVINLAGASANVVMNLIMIPSMGIAGAALASLITQIFTNVIMGFVLKQIRENNRIMYRSLNPKLMISTIKAFCERSVNND